MKPKHSCGAVRLPPHRCDLRLIAEAFAMFDTDGNGEIDREEFGLVQYGLNGGWLGL